MFGGPQYEASATNTAASCTISHIMPVSKIKIDDVLIEESRFSAKGFLFGTDAPGCSPADPFSKLGILYPVVAFRGADGKLHLVDGEKRIRFAALNGQSMIDAVVLPDTAAVTDIITFLLCTKGSMVQQSVMNRVQFICFAMEQKAPETWIIEELCPLFGFKPYRVFLEDCRRICRLPAGIRLFCHEKKFSMKQILNLAHYPEEILLQLMEWRGSIQLTASIMDEIASNLRDHITAANKTFRELLDEGGIQEIIRSDLSPRDRTDRLREFIRARRYPTLSRVNAKMDRSVEDMDLPGGISVAWDRTLENRNVDITIHLQDIRKFDGLLDKLNSLEIKRTVGQLLEEL